jgi:hypothetical protein
MVLATFCDGHENGATLQPGAGGAPGVPQSG